jgi:hypothetical protein
LTAGSSEPFIRRDRQWRCRACAGCLEPRAAGARSHARRGRSCADSVTLQERRDRRGGLQGVGQRQEMASPGNHHILRLRQPGKDELVNFCEPRATGNPAEVENRLGDTPCVLAAETPGRQRGQICGEESIGIAFGLSGSAGKVLVDVMPPVRPDEPGQEQIERSCQPVPPVMLDELLVRGQELAGAGYMRGRRFDKAHAVHTLRCAGRQLQGDRAAVGQPGHMRALDPQPGQQPPAVDSVPGNGFRPVDQAAPGRPPRLVQHNRVIGPNSQRAPAMGLNSSAINAVWINTTDSPEPRTSASSAASGTMTRPYSAHRPTGCGGIRLAGWLLAMPTGSHPREGPP